MKMHRQSCYDSIHQSHAFSYTRDILSTKRNSQKLFNRQPSTRRRGLHGRFSSMQQQDFPKIEQKEEPEAPKNFLPPLSISLQTIDLGDRATGATTTLNTNNDNAQRKPKKLVKPALNLNPNLGQDTDQIGFCTQPPQDIANEPLIDMETTYLGKIAQKTSKTAKIGTFTPN